MTWSIRGKKRYYYRKICDGKTSRKVYLGTGATAELHAGVDEQRRREKSAAKELLRAEEERLQSLEAPLKALHQLVHSMTEAGLLVAGFHRHDRGPWRKWRAAE